MGEGASQQSARERMRAQRQRQAKRQRTTRRALIAASAVAVVALVVGIGVFVQTQRAASNNVQPVSIAAGSGKLVVHVYEDFQCPACRQFEQASGAMLARLARQGKAQVQYHPLSIFQGVLAERSVRAASAAMCARDQGKFLAYHKLLFEKQPPESKPEGAADTSPPAGNVSVERLRGFETWKLIRYGQSVGLDSPQFAQCVKSDRYEARIKASSDKVLSSGKVTATPTVYVGNQKISQQSGLYTNPAALKQRILRGQR